MNERYRTLFTEQQIDTRIDELAREIVIDHFDDNPLYVALMRGALPFASKLMFAIHKYAPTIHPDLDTLTVSTYRSGQEPGEPRIVTDLSPASRVYGRTVIVLDDVLDKGLTAEFVTRHLQGLGALGIELAVLVQKHVDQIHEITPTYCGFQTGDEWLTGMGMDDDAMGPEHNRWLPEIKAIKRDDEPPQLAELTNV